MNAFTLLKADHKKVAGILEKLDSTTERGVKTREGKARPTDRDA